MTREAQDRDVIVKHAIRLICSECGRQLDGDFEEGCGATYIKVEPCEHCLEAAAYEGRDD